MTVSGMNISLPALMHIVFQMAMLASHFLLPVYIHQTPEQIIALQQFMGAAQALMGMGALWAATPKSADPTPPPQPKL